MQRNIFKSFVSYFSNLFITLRLNSISISKPKIPKFMEKRIRSEGDLPEAMIQHIQSFMSGKEAAQTTILSKSWYNSWLTRPNLVFDHRDFSKYGYFTQEFSKFSKKTMQRYRDLNLKIDSFKFRMPFKGSHSLANDLTVEAIKMGATDICLKISSYSEFVLPGEVLQSESLTRLSLRGCKMERVKVNCSTLKSLRLSNLFLEEDFFWDIFLSCPLIEGLELRDCEYKLCGLNKRNKSINLSKEFELHKLKTLLLEKVKLYSLFFSDFSMRFPCLKNLSIHNCSCYQKVKIYSQSLEFISFVDLRKNFKAVFDVPNLRKFSFSGKRFLPLVSFPNSCNWMSNVYISFDRHDIISAKWFLNLNKLLKNLSLSKVSLNLKSYFLDGIDKAENTQCLPRPLVENLTIDVHFRDCATLLDNLIQWCRPVFVTRDFSSYSHIDRKTRIESLKIVFKRLMQQRNSVGDLEEIKVEVFFEKDTGWRTILKVDEISARVFNLSGFWLRTILSVDDLDEISARGFDELISGWWTIPEKPLQDTSTVERVRFHLRWGQH